jgi:hypothetical protein
MVEYLIFIIYDGINNSVFHGQVAQPIIAKKKADALINIHLISFESSGRIDESIVRELIDNGIVVHSITKSLFFIINVYRLRKLLSTLSSYEIIARGPLAAYLCLKAKTANCKKIIAQARGLLAQEYTYVHQNSSSIILKILRYIRCYQFNYIERSVYTYQSPDYFIESVSPALKDYLISHYARNSESIFISKNDIPSPIELHTKHAWRISMRAKLNIPLNAYVYCYNGSAKAWQCPEQIIDFFIKTITHQPHALLLLLTQDKEIFLAIISRKNIPVHTYRIVHSAHANIYAYLSAADAGILFREKHLINWISRPTKLLEYHATGLAIIHNNTVAYTLHTNQL